MPDLESMVKSHEERMNKYEIRLGNHSERLNHHEKRLDQDKIDIQNLKDYDQDKHKRLKVVEENYARLETTVAKENEETRATMREQTTRLFDIVEQSMDNQESRTAQNHELRMARLNTWSTVVLKLGGAVAALGSAAYYILQNILDK